jgi:hypothetical protein
MFGKKSRPDWHQAYAQRLGYSLCEHGCLSYGPAATCEEGRRLYGEFHRLLEQLPEDGSLIDQETMKAFRLASDAYQHHLRYAGGGDKHVW